MNNLFRLAAHSLPMLALATAVCAAADRVQCPAEISVREQIAAAVSGWTAGAEPSAHLLGGITFFDGTPEEKASLAPDRENKSGTKTISTWTLGGTGRPVWVSCRYASTTVTLSRELKDVRACSVTYNTRQSIGGLPAIETIDCK